eukprot:c10034_g1_i2.p1 GENE.c10034_g1_i2~~c10034_g1_i2.p1  ORF type:complete len:879 (-),score=134.74 c10034_g1_i2:106-2742(-)
MFLCVCFAPSRIGRSCQMPSHFAKTFIWRIATLPAPHPHSVRVFVALAALLDSSPAKACATVTWGLIALLQLPNECSIESRKIVELLDRCVETTSSGHSDGHGKGEEDWDIYGVVSENAEKFTTHSRQALLSYSLSKLSQSLSPTNASISPAASLKISQSSRCNHTESLSSTMCAAPALIDRSVTAISHVPSLIRAARVLALPASTPTTERPFAVDLERLLVTCTWQLTTPLGLCTLLARDLFWKAGKTSAAVTTPQRRAQQSLRHGITRLRVVGQLISDVIGIGSRLPAADPNLPLHIKYSLCCVIWRITTATNSALLRQNANLDPQVDPACFAYAQLIELAKWSRSVSRSDSRAVALVSCAAVVTLPRVVLAHHHQQLGHAQHKPNIPELRACACGVGAQHFIPTIVLWELLRFLGAASNEDERINPQDISDVSDFLAEIRECLALHKQRSIFDLLEDDQNDNAAARFQALETLVGLIASTVECDSSMSHTHPASILTEQLAAGLEKGVALSVFTALGDAIQRILWRCSHPPPTVLLDRLAGLFEQHASSQSSVARTLLQCVIATTPKINSLVPILLSVLRERRIVKLENPTEEGDDDDDDDAQMLTFTHSSPSDRMTTMSNQVWTNIVQVWVGNNKPRRAVVALELLAGIAKDLDSRTGHDSGGLGTLTSTIIEAMSVTFVRLTTLDMPTTTAPICDVLTKVLEILDRAVLARAKSLPANEPLTLQDPDLDEILTSIAAVQRNAPQLMQAITVHYEVLGPDPTPISRLTTTLASVLDSSAILTRLLRARGKQLSQETSETATPQVAQVKAEGPQSSSKKRKQPETKRSTVKMLRSLNPFIDAALQDEGDEIGAPDDYSDLEGFIVVKRGKSYHLP